MGLRRYILGRAISSFVTVLVIILLNFFLFHLVPGDPFSLKASVVPVSVLNQLRHQYGLDQPLYVQFVDYIVQLFQGNLGYSVLQLRPVSSLIALHLPATLILMVPAFLLSLVPSLLMAPYAVKKRGGKFDLGVLLSSLTLTSIPQFWLGGLLLLVFAVEVHAFPPSGMLTPAANYPNIFSYLGDLLRHLVLPMLTYSLIFFGVYFLLSRNVLLNVFTEDYMLTAQAKGLSQPRILYSHAMRNAMLPLSTLIAIGVGFLIGGAILIEDVFNWPGIGLLTVQAITMRDYPLMEGCFFVLTVSVILANFVADVAYAFLDPRVRY